LYLREFSNEDAASMFELNNDADVIKYTGDKAFVSVEEARLLLENYDQYSLYGFGRWAVIQKSTGNFIGWCGLKYSATTDEVDIGFRFFKAVWNQGFATEAAKKCIQLGFDTFGIKRIVGRAMVDNIASVKVLEKLGLTFLKEFDFDGEEGVIYEIVCNEKER
jgi:ribosomal-protein-alanine N-acetyltransferase